MALEWVRMLPNLHNGIDETWYLLDPNTFEHNTHYATGTDTKGFRLYIRHDHQDTKYIKEVKLYVGESLNRIYYKDYTNQHVTDTAPIFKEIDAIVLIASL